MAISWKLLKRTVLLKTKFLTVFQDTIELPSGEKQEYFMTKKPDIVLVVATTSEGKIILVDEYQYAAGKSLLMVPAGHHPEEEDAVTTARRELMEETGYGGGEVIKSIRLYESPVRDLHQVDVIQLENVVPMAHPAHESTEFITTRLVDIRDVQKFLLDGALESCSTLGALAVCGMFCNPDKKKT